MQVSLLVVVSVLAAVLLLLSLCSLVLALCRPCPATTSLLPGTHRWW